MVKYIRINRLGNAYYIRDDVAIRYDLELLSARQLSAMAEMVVSENHKHLIELTDREFNIETLRP